MEHHSFLLRYAPGLLLLQNLSMAPEGLRRRLSGGLNPAGVLAQPFILLRSGSFLAVPSASGLLVIVIVSVQTWLQVC